MRQVCSHAPTMGGGRSDSLNQSQDFVLIFMLRVVSGPWSSWFQGSCICPRFASTIVSRLYVCLSGGFWAGTRALWPAPYSLSRLPLRSPWHLSLHSRPGSQWPRHTLRVHTPTPGPWHMLFLLIPPQASVSAKVSPAQGGLFP